MVTNSKTNSRLIEKIRNLQSKLSKTEECFNAFSEISSEGIIIHKNGRIIDASKAAALMLGYEKEVLTGSKIADIIDKSTIEQLSENKKHRGIESYIKLKTGKLKNCRIKTATVMYKGSDASVFLIQDISNMQNTREINERFRKLFDTSFEAIAIHENGKIVEVNEACTQLSGYTREELKNINAFELVFQDDRKFVAEQVRQNREMPYEARGVKKDGTVFWGEFNAKEIKFGGKTTRVVTFRDISDRRQYEAQLRQAKEDYENLIRHSPDGIFILDEKGKILFANPSAHHILGVKSPEEIKGKSTFRFVLPKYHAQIRERALMVKGGYSPPFMKMEAVRIDGSIVDVEYKPVIIDYNGKKAMLVVYHDIDFQEQLSREKLRLKVAEETNYALTKEIEERKRIEAQLEKSKNQYKIQSAKLNSIIESSSHIVWTVDRNISLTAFNKNFSLLLEKTYGRKPFLKDPINKSPFISTNAANTFWNNRFYATFKGLPQHFEASFLNKKGTPTWLEIYLNPIFDEKGDVKEVSGIGHDITAKKEAEERIKQSLKEKEVLLKEVHHRVKNNLQVISSILNLQSSYITDVKVIDLLKESQNRIKSMSFIHESLYQTEDFSSVKFSSYIEHLANNLLLSYKPKEKNISLVQKIDNVFLNLDQAIPCGLIINELVSNALKYAFEKKQNGKLNISIDIDKKENVTVVIGDNGPGLPKDINYRNTQSLGLQLVMVLVSQLRGTIKLDNTKGAKYTIIFNKRNVN